MIIVVYIKFGFEFQFLWGKANIIQRTLASQVQLIQVRPVQMSQVMLSQKFMVIETKNEI